MQLGLWGGTCIKPWISSGAFIHITYTWDPIRPNEVLGVHHCTVSWISVFSASSGEAKRKKVGLRWTKWLSVNSLDRAWMVSDSFPNFNPWHTLTILVVPIDCRFTQFLWVLWWPRKLQAVWHLHVVTRPRTKPTRADVRGWKRYQTGMQTTRIHVPATSTSFT